MLRRMIHNITGLEVAVAAGAFAAVFFVGLSVVYLVDQQKKRKKTMAEVASGRRDQALPAEIMHKSRVLAWLEKVGNFISHGRASTNLWEQLIRAGFMNKNAAAIYTGIKMILFLIGLIVAAILIGPLDYPMEKKILWIFIAGLVPFFIPNLQLRKLEKRRCDEIQLYLPDVIDLLEISVSSGVGLDMAWNLVAKEINGVSRVLGTSMELSNFEMYLGASRTTAMKNMAVRSGAPQLSSLAAILIQSERFGTSIAEALKEFALSMRDERQSAAEEMAEKIAVKLIFPMVFFLFPAILIVVLGPAVIQMMNGIIPT